MALVTFLVEDNKTIRENLIPVLEDMADAQVVGFAETESAAAHWLRENGEGWHLAVVDMFLKEGSGLGVLRSCANRARHQRVVVLTNYATDDMRERCLALKADAVFDKSNQIDDFIDYCTRRWASQFGSL